MDLLGFAFAVLLVELTPGPNMAWLVALTLSEGRRSGLAAITGIATGLAANATISVLAVSFVLQHSEWLARGISLLGAVMMAWLAWEAWQGEGESSPTNVPRDKTQRSFAAGFTINLLNPKATLFFITVMPQFVSDARPTYVQAITLAGISVLIATLVHLALVFAAEPLRPILIDKGRAIPIRRVLALIMLCVGGWFLSRALL
ncbi:LysE family translocator [uncultured Erythrobacter sp.]|uniref:LysE family translocator n=1 Tax=uncultured Erythrobacter sp. TaxID=263913 RepID=UPI0026049FE6|nr:LysE family translocator [uncultured Erythrobacter sp.]